MQKNFDAIFFIFVALIIGIFVGAIFFSSNGEETTTLKYEIKRDRTKKVVSDIQEKLRKIKRDRDINTIEVIIVHEP